MRVPTATSEDKCLTPASLPLAIFVVSIPFNLGTISNHHLFVIDVDMGSLIGEDFPRVVRLPARKLQDVPAKPTSNHIVGISSNTASSKYTKSFYSAIIPFRMKRSRKQRQIDKLDLQKSEFMTCAESYCRKIFSGKTPYSSTIAKWLARRRVFVWMLRQRETVGGPTQPLQEVQSLRQGKILPNQSQTTV